MIGFLLGIWAGSLAMVVLSGWRRRRAAEQWRAEQAAHEEAPKADTVELDEERQTIRVGRAVYSIDFLASFPTLRGHFRMAGPVKLSGGLLTCEVTTTTHLVRGAAAHLVAVRDASGPEADQLVGKALALLDLADAEVAAKELIDGMRA